MPERPPPVLAKGRHLFSRRQGCFGEVASALAGEHWTARPRCVHPVLAAAAGRVNELTSDAALPRLAPLVPLAIDTADDDPGHATRLALFCLEWVSDIDSRHHSALDASALTAELLLDTARPAVIEARHSPQASELNKMLSPSLDSYARRAAPRVAALVCDVIGETADDPDAALADFLASLLRFARAHSTPGSP